MRRDPLSLFVGPLAGPECRRALGRGWLILVRVLAGLALGGATLLVLWTWWMWQRSDPRFSPYGTLRYGLTTVEGMLLTIALVLGPALLAGSIAGEKERGVLALLLTTRVNAGEIIAGRLAGKLSQVSMILLAGVPAVVALAALAGMNPGIATLLLALPAAVAFGGAGLAILASTLCRRGRDALLTVYLLDVVFLLSPLGVRRGWWSGGLSWLGGLNPYACLDDLIWREEGLVPSLSVASWLAIGALATAAAAWRLRAACLRPLDGERLPGVARRRRRIPAPDERRPMLWKELYIERVGAVGALAKGLGAFLVLLLGGGSLVLLGLLAWGTWTSTSVPATQALIGPLGSAAFLFGWLIEWAVGLRAAVAISSERERGTWDALLTSPLEGREIVRAKLWGSLHALRWLFAATLLAWTVLALAKGISWFDYADYVVGTAVTAAFMAAVGVRTSLAAATATRAMTITIGIWLGSLVVISTLAALLLGVAALAFFATEALATAGRINPPGWLFRAWDYAWPLTINALYLLATLLLVADTRLRFDRIAGRMTEGKVATGVDRLIHGKPKSPWRPKVSEAGPTISESEALVPWP